MLHTILYYSTNLYYTTVYITVYTVLNTVVYYVLYGTIVLICIMQYFYTEISTNIAEFVLGPTLGFHVFSSKIIYKYFRNTTIENTTVETVLHDFRTLRLHIHRVPKKTCDYIFYNNFNNKCPITIIFGIVSSKSMRHRKMVSFPTSPI